MTDTARRAQPVDTAGIADLLRRVEQSASAYICGDMDTYFELIEHTGDFTLMSPLGGPTVHGVDLSEERMEENRRFFASGEATIEFEQICVSGDLAVLVVVERQHGEVGGTPDQDWSLRVTLVFRWEDGDWKLAHRHADPLVHPVSFADLGSLARGEAIG